MGMSDKTFRLSLSWDAKINGFVYWLVQIMYYSICSLKHINVAMVTILKNVTNVITALGETYLFGKYHDTKVWTALALMVILIFIVFEISKFPKGQLLIWESWRHNKNSLWQLLLNVFSLLMYCIRQACRYIDILGTEILKLFFR